jgi:hypothetical protein
VNRRGTLSVVETVRSKSLGAALRELREKAQFKPKEAATRLGWSASKLARTEKGATLPTEADLLAALDLYGTADAQRRAELVQLRRDARRRNWYVMFSDVFSTSLPALEHDANRIRNYETNVVPGLLQTADYARELIAAALPDADPDVIDKRVRARMARQDAVFLRRDAPAVHFIIDETVLLRPVGGREVMREQLSALWSASRRPIVTVQVVPLSVGAHVGLEGPFAIMNFDNPQFPEVVFTEGPGGHAYLEGELDLRRISLAWDRLAVAALSPEDSAARCAELTRE